MSASGARSRMPTLTERVPRRCWRDRIVGAMAGALCLVAGSLPSPVKAADTLLVNGRILTLDARSQIVDALAIRDDVILATGDGAALRARAAPDTRIIDLGGRTVIPGLIDSHIHAIRAGRHFAVEVSWIGATSIAEALARIERAAAEAGPDRWIVGAGGGAPHQIPPRRRPPLAGPPPP